MRHEILRDRLKTTISYIELYIEFLDQFVYLTITSKKYSLYGCITRGCEAHKGNNNINNTSKPSIS